MIKETYFKSVNNYLIKILNGMAMGLFASLIIGLIIKQLGALTNIYLFINIGQIAQYCMGPAIGVAVGYTLGAPPLGIFSCAICGLIGSNSIILEEAQTIIKVGEPVGATIASVVGVEV